MLKLLELIIPRGAGEIGTAASTSGISVAMGAAGLTGQVPGGIPEAVWAVLMLVAPTLGAIVFGWLRVKQRGDAARKRAEAAEELRLAELEEGEGKARLEDGDKTNDADGKRLLDSARVHRIRAAGLSAEGEALEEEAARRRLN